MAARSRRRRSSRARATGVVLASSWLAACAAREGHEPPLGSAGRTSDSGAAGESDPSGRDGASGAAAGRGTSAGGSDAAGAAADDWQPESAPAVTPARAERSPWAGAFGSLCGPGDQTVVRLVASRAPGSCEAWSEVLSGDAEDFIRVELPHVPDGELESFAKLPARYCSGGLCQDGELELTFAADGDGGSRGTFTLSLGAGRVTKGDIAMSSCAWDDHVPAAPLELGVRGLALRELAVFQGVKVPLMERGIELSPGRAGVVAGRRGLFRLAVAPGADWKPRPVRARLTLWNGDDSDSFERTLTIERLSDDGALDSTFNFDVPAALLREDTRYALELLETEACAASGERSPGRFPASGTVKLGARAVGSVSVEVIPLRIRSANGALLPDTSPAQMALLRDALVGLFPVSGVDLRVRSPAVDSAATSVLEAVDHVAALRDAEGPPRHLSYYGLFRFTEGIDEYCLGNCVLGAGVVGDMTSPAAGVAVGVGYTGDISARTFAHELGHVYGREHSPCEIAGDPAYPYSGGRTGEWGYDLIRGVLVPPTHADFMSYCAPFWVSDYVFGHLGSFIQSVNADVALSDSRGARRFRTVLDEVGAPPRLGLPRVVRGDPPGKRERARAFTERGATSEVIVYRSRVEDLGAALVYVPDPIERGWSRLRLRTGVTVEYDRSTDSLRGQGGRL